MCLQMKDSFMGMFQEFKKFAMRGSVLDLAVGVVIGGAFGKIVTALVEKIIMPITSLLTGGVNIADKAITIPLPEALAAQGMKPATIGWGAFAQAIVDFLIIAFAIFLVIKALNKAQLKEKAAPPPTPEEILLLREIRDQLKK